MSDVTPSNADKPSDEPVDAAPDAVTETPVEAADTPADVTAAADTAPADTAQPPTVEPQDPATPLVEPEPILADTAAVRSAVAEPAEPRLTGEVAPVAVPATVAAASAVPTQQLVYVAPPAPPRKRGNRVVGILLVLVGGVLFAGLYALIVVALNHFYLNGRFFGAGSNEFLNVFRSAYFSVAVGSFLVLTIIMVLLLNRAGWWAHVFGSLVLAIAVYFAVIGGLLFIGNTLHYSPDPLTFADLAVSPWVIASAVVAREVSIWIGLGISARGRRVKARNVEARAAFDREQEATKTEYAETAAV